jgi:ribosomal protein L9
MKLLLRKDIHKLGLCGDIVDVSDGYAPTLSVPHNRLRPSGRNLKASRKTKVAAVERAEGIHHAGRNREAIAGSQVW